MNISQDRVDELIAEGLSLFATKEYVDLQDAQNATAAYIDQQDALRLGLNHVNVDNGVPGLDSSGRVDKSRVNIPSTQEYPMAWWSPSAYNAGTVNATSESTVYTMTVTDPGFPYRLVVSGTVDVTTNTNGEYPIVRVREDFALDMHTRRGAEMGRDYRWFMQEASRVIPEIAGKEQKYREWILKALDAGKLS